MLKIVLLLALATMGNGQSNAAGPPPNQHTLSVVGTGAIQALPDVATVRLNVQVTKPSAAEARAEAATTANAVVAAVKAVNGFNDSDVATTNLAVFPQYTWVEGRNGGTQTITGYTFQQQLTVTVKNLTNDVLGGVVDAAVEAGGNSVQIDSITTDLSPPMKQEATNAARKLAVADGVATASALAEAAGVALGSVSSIVDQSGSAAVPQPFASSGAFAAADVAMKSAPTPVTIGNTQVVATVSMQWALK